MAAGLDDGVGSIELDTAPLKVLGKGTRGAELGARFYDGRHFNAVVKGEGCGGKGEVARSENRHPGPAESLVFLDKGAHALRANYTYEVAAGEAQGQVSGAGGEDQPVVFEHPGFTVIAETKDGLRNVAAVLPVPEAAPNVDAGLYVDYPPPGRG